MPRYKVGVDDRNPPEATALKEATARSDAVLVVTRDHTRSIPCALENAIDSIAAAVRSLSQQRTVEETLQTIASVTRSSVPGFDQVGIATLGENGQVVTRAHIGDLVPRLDEIQYGLGEGPCVDTLRGDEVVAAPRLQDQTQWPGYVPQAVALGVRSQLAVRLHRGDGSTLGGVNLYSTTSEEVSENATALASFFAAHSDIALGHVQERAQLSEAVQSRKIIGQALGILMERYDMNEERAFAFLVRSSNHGNIKLRSIAQELVDGHNRE
jgi:GAF domain-containing protein